MSDQFDFGGEIVWRPDESYLERAHLTAFIRRYNLDSFEALMERSTHDVAWFTEAILEYLDIHFYEPYTQVVDMQEGIAHPKWCLDGVMNIVHNCLDKYIGTRTENQTAVIWEGESGETQSLSYKELYGRVNAVAEGLRGLGLGKGDAIGLYMPMTPEIVVALLAIAKIGGIILPLFSGYGIEAVASRLMDANAKAIITADGFTRRARTVLMKPVADEAVLTVPSLEHMVVLNYAGVDVTMQAGRDHLWGDLIEAQPELSPTERTAAEDPLMIIYTSGTTGRPKGAVHTHCGFPIKAAQDMAFGTDVHAGDIIYWMTDMGWMMGPWLVFGALLLGGTMFIYDGAPDYPGPERIWSMVARHGIHILGISPTLVRALIKYGEAPFRQYDLTSLRFFASTGEPWNPDPWMWLFDTVGGGERPIINYSGGTEISGGIVMGNPILPLKACAFSAACPGIAADVFNENGKPVRGQVGELVIKAPWIGMTRGFWQDPQRYEETYWSRWPDVWVHGDFAAIDADGMWYILGRSDDTIKVAGKRLGPAEIESIVVQDSGVIEAAAIGVPHEIKGSEVVLFVVLGENSIASDELRFELHDLVVRAMGKPLAPKEIIFVSDLPKTRNAKVMRRMIRAAYLGLDPGDQSSLVNPEALEEIRNLRK
jgi:acetyl-CoA synthetase